MAGGRHLACVKTGLHLIRQKKAAVFAAEEGKPGALVVHDDHLQEGLAELLVAGGPLTRSLLGAAGAVQA